jgi:hypothetical protein
MDGDDSVAGVVFTGEKRLSFKPVDQLAERADFALQVAIDVFAFFCQIEVGGNVIGAAGEIGVGGEHVLEALLLAHHLLRTQGVRPQIRFGSLLFDFG